ncbi:hypothetical protein [Geodermatophilus sp. SYSU D00815]
MTPSDHLTAAQERLHAAVGGFASAAGRAYAALRATLVATGTATEERVQAARVLLAADRATREQAAAGQHDVLRAALTEGMLALPPAARMSFRGAGWSDRLDHPPAGLPGLFRVGALATGGGEDLTEALLPNPATANVTLVGGAADRPLLLGVVESLLVRAIATAPTGGLLVHVLDPHQSGTSLARFGPVGATPTGVFAPTAVTASDIRDTLDGLARRVATVSQRYLQGSHATLAEYNATTGVAEPCHLVVALDVAHYGPAELDRLLTLARTGAASGVHVLALVDTDASARSPGVDLAPLTEVDAGLAVTDGGVRLTGVDRDHGVVVEPPPASDLVRAVIAAAEARVGTSDRGGPVLGEHDASTAMSWAEYRAFVSGLLAHQALVSVIGPAVEEAEERLREWYEADRVSTAAQLRTHVQHLGRVVVDVGRRVADVRPEAVQELTRVLRDTSTGVSGPLPFGLDGVPRVLVDDVLAPVDDGLREVTRAIGEVHRAAREAEDDRRLRAWTRRRTSGLALDAVVLPLVFGGGTTALALLYWRGQPPGPLLAAAATAGLSLVAWVVVALSRSWVFGRLAFHDARSRLLHEPTDRGGVEAALLMGGIGALLYGPAPRPERDWFLAAVLDPLDDALVYVAPFVGLALCVLALRDVRVLVREPSYAELVRM